MNIFRIAWRNLWRNARRTGITLAAISTSTLVLIVTYGLIIGMMQQMEHSVTDMTVGQVQVHHPDYRAERSLYDTVAEPGAVLETARDNDIPATARAFGFGLLSSGTKSAGVQFRGIDPVSERAVSELHKHLSRGAFISDSPRREVVLGRKLARTLNARVGTSLVVVVQAADGSLGNELFTVSGVLKSVGETLDRSAALIHRDDFAELFVFPGRYHELAFNTAGLRLPEEVKATLKPVTATDEILTWRELMPALADMLATYEGSMFLFQLIFFLAAGLGVLNTMLMSTFERIPEFGIMKAIGASPWRVIKEVTAEAMLLGLCGSLVGGILGTALCRWLSVHPIDLSGFAEGFNTSGVAISAQWAATLTFDGVFWPVTLMWLVSVLAALYPAVKAARLDPVEALTHI